MMQTANVFSEDEGQLMVENPMVRRMMGADASDELAKLVLDEFSFKIRAAAESSKEGLSARDIEGLIDDFMQKHLQGKDYHKFFDFFDFIFCQQKQKKNVL